MLRLHVRKTVCSRVPAASGRGLWNRKTWSGCVRCLFKCSWKASILFTHSLISACSQSRLHNSR